MRCLQQIRQKRKRWEVACWRRIAQGQWPEAVTCCVRKVEDCQLDSLMRGIAAEKGLSLTTSGGFVGSTLQLSCSVHCSEAVPVPLTILPLRWLFVRLTLHIFQPDCFGHCHFIRPEQCRSALEGWAMGHSRPLPGRRLLEAVPRRGGHRGQSIPPLPCKQLCHQLWITLMDMTELVVQPALQKIPAVII